MTEQPPNQRRRSAIGASFDTYYRDRDRTARMDRLHADLIKQGALVFDIGAHVGDRTCSFARLGARVVAVEPQPAVFRALRLLFASDPAVVLRHSAVGAVAGMIELYLNSDNPTVSTASKDLIAAAQSAQMWQGQTWDATTQVPVTTLDHLIAEFGLPDFVKIDVEGFEHEVLLGLSQPLPLFSFEFTTIQRDVAVACLGRVAELGQYHFNLSLGETHYFRQEAWCNATQMAEILMDLPEVANSGDIYARRQT